MESPSRGGAKGLTGFQPLFMERSLTPTEDALRHSQQLPDHQIFPFQGTEMVKEHYKSCKIWYFYYKVTLNGSPCYFTKCKTPSTFNATTKCLHHDLILF